MFGSLMESSIAGWVRMRRTRGFRRKPLRRVDARQVAQGGRVGRRRDELVPELGDQERRVARVREDHVDDLAMAEGAGLAEHRLLPVVPARAVEVAHRGVGVLVVDLPARAGAGRLADVGLGVVRLPGGVGHAEAEQLHQLAPVVLVDRALGAVLAGEEAQHRRPLPHLVDELAEVRRRVGGVVGVAAHEVVLVRHQLRRRDLLARGGEVPVPEEREALDERVAGAQHPVAPGQHHVGVRLEGLQGRAVVADGLGPRSAGPGAPRSGGRPPCGATGP